MKRKQNNLDKNISRLVKLTRESDIPSEKFVDSLIDDALEKLDQPEQIQLRSERNTTMKLTFKKTLAIAAGFILLATITTTIILPTFTNDKTPSSSTANKPGTGIKVTQRAIPDKLMPIPLILPKAMFVGTPQNISVSNLEKPRKRPRPPFMAPVDTVNVAAGKPVSSSDEYPIIGEIELITNNDKEASDGCYLEIGPGIQHVTIDIGAKYNIYAIVAWHYHKQPRVYYDVVVQVADDADFTKNVVTLFNNDIDNSAGLGAGKDYNYVETNEGKLIDAKGVQARYVRIYGNGNSSNDFNHFIEIEVFGKAINLNIDETKDDLIPAEIIRYNEDE